MTKAEIINTISEKTEMSKKDVSLIVDTMIIEVKEVIKSEDKINFAGFGSFEPKTNKARVGINPATKEKIQIAESKSVKFKVSKTFKEELN